MKQRKQSRSDCPISFSLELVGDIWSLLIIRDIVYANKQTFNDFLSSDEHIARNILADRLTTLTEKGIIHRTPHHSDKRKEVYTLTNKGMALIPVLQALSAWGTAYKHEFSH